jgi:hypothetical protein
MRPANTIESFHRYILQSEAAWLAESKAPGRTFRFDMELKQVIFKSEHGIHFEQAQSGNS